VVERAIALSMTQSLAPDPLTLCNVFRVRPEPSIGRPEFIHSPPTR